MITKRVQLELTNLMQDQNTDLDIYREKPFVYDNGRGLLLIVKPLSFLEHDIFLKAMAKLIISYYEIFMNLDFLSNQNYKDKDTINNLTAKVGIFTADKKYRAFKKSAIKFVTKWAYVSKKKNKIDLNHDKKLCKKIIKTMEPSDFIYILFLLFVYNFDIVKKNLLGFMEMFKQDVTLEYNLQTGISSRGILEKVVAMPKYSVEPFNKSTLDLLEQQSKIQ
jgi:hypothetical protein